MLELCENWLRTGWAGLPVCVHSQVNRLGDGFPESVLIILIIMEHYDGSVLAEMCGKCAETVWNMCGKCVGHVWDRVSNLWKIGGTFSNISAYFSTAHVYL